MYIKLGNMAVVHSPANSTKHYLQKAYTFAFAANS